MLTFTKSGGESDGQIEGVVVDPGKVTGDAYTVGFAVSPDPDWTEPIWYMENSAGTRFLMIRPKWATFLTMTSS